MASLRRTREDRSQYAARIDPDSESGPDTGEKWPQRRTIMRRCGVKIKQIISRYTAPLQISTPARACL